MPKKKQRERRRRGDGTVSVAKRDASGKPILWKASISLGWVMINGKRTRNRPTEYAETEAEGHLKLKQLQAQHLAGDDFTSGNEIFEAFLIRWLEHIKTIRSLGTWMVYESHCRCHIIPALGSLKPKAIQVTHVQTMLNALVAQGMKPNTVKSIRATLIRALNAARIGGLLKLTDPNVAVKTEIPAVIQKKPPALSDAQLARLLDVLAGDSLEEIVLVALGTGCRISEVLGILWANVDYETEELHITGAIKCRPLDGRDAPYRLIREAVKTKDERTTHLSAPVAEALKARHKRQQQERREAGASWQEQGLVFTDAHGGPLRPPTISSRFGQRARQANLPPGFTFHGLRHDAASGIIKQGGHQRVVMEVLGHKSIQTSARYGQVSEASRDALDKIGQRLTRRRGAK